MGAQAKGDDGTADDRDGLGAAGAAAARALAPAPAIGRLRRRLKRCAPAVVVAALVWAPSAAASYSAADYWAFADRLQPKLDALWDPALGAYRDASGDGEVRLNGALLTTHAIAALSGHTGPARQDLRAASIARNLLATPPFVDGTGSSGEGHDHAPGWMESVTRPAVMHVAIDPQVAEGLAHAHAARHVIGLSEAEAALIADRIHRVAGSPFFRYPSLRLNQFNWHADLYAADHRVTGDAGLLRRDYRAQLARFVRHLDRAATEGGSPNLNEGYGLHYAPARGATFRVNRSHTSEYANLIFSGLRHYDDAVAAGMRPLGSRAEEQLRAWGERTMFGDWTHAGYLNWDSGLSLRRWHMARYLGHAGRGLLTLATGRRLSAPRGRAYAKWLFDGYLDAYTRRAAREPAGLLAAMPFGLLGPRAFWDRDPGTTAARFQSHAATAALLGLGGAASVEPPPFFAHDGDIRRLALSTPAYSTALSGSDRTGYGGLEPARLYDARQDPLTGIGGNRSAALGLELARGGRVVLDTQPGTRAFALRLPRWRIGPGSAGSRGVFARLTARSHVRAGGDRIAVTHVFTRASLLSVRTLRSRAGGTVTLRLPVWGRDGDFTVEQRPDGRLAVSATAERGRYSATIGGVAGAEVGVATIPVQAGNPGVSRVLRISFPLRPGGVSETRVRLVPGA